MTTEAQQLEHHEPETTEALLNGAAEKTAMTSSPEDDRPKVKTLKIKRPEGAPKKDGKDGASSSSSSNEDLADEAKGGELSPQVKALKNADHMAVKDWLQLLVAETNVRVHVSRREPKFFIDPRTGVEKKCDGRVATYEKVIDEEELHRRHGGGTYQLVVQVRNSKGQWSYFGARTIELAGDPKLDDVPRMFVPPPAAPAVPVAGADPTTQMVLGRAFDIMERANERERARPPSSSSGADIAAAVAAATEPLHRTIEMLQREISAMRAANDQPSFKDQLLNKFIDGDSARVQSIRTQHESEIRMLKEAAVVNENRLRDQHQRDLERMERSHERELAAMKSSYETQKAALESANATQKMVLDSEIKRLERDLQSKETELAALRAKKEQSLKDKVEELKGVKELLDGDDDGDDEDKSTAVKIIEAASQLPVVSALAERLAGGAAPQVAAPPPQAQIPAPRARPRLLRNKQTGEVLAQGPNGEVVPVKRVVEPPAENPQAVVPPVDPAMIKTALEYMEGAFRSGVDPKTFADSARPMIPDSILGAIRALGIDAFMVKVAQLPGTSPLATQGGRNWRRKVAAHLLGESDEG